MRIIEYIPKYKKQIIDLLIEVAVNEYGFKEWEKWFRIFKNENYKDEGGNCWVALNDKDEVIGTLSLKNRENGVGELKNLYIKREERNKGVGTSLFAILLKFAIDKHYIKLKLDTYKEFKDAMNFYKDRGFYIDEKDGDRYIYELDLNEKISVIVPVYNVESEIENCLDSILSQTYENLQIILVDDGSLDESGKICDIYAKKDKRIEVIHKKNGGLADARNIGLKKAKGEYVAFLDSDDYIYPTFYEELYKLVKEYGADISECDFSRINIEDKGREKGIIEELNTKEPKQEIETNIDALRLLYGPRLKPYIKKVVVWNKLYKRHIFKNISFPLGKLHEDEYTTYKILNSTKRIVSTNKILHGYMQTKNSIMRQEIKQKRIDDNLDAYIKSSEYFNEQNLPEIEMMSRRRYLENCIELAGKVAMGNGLNKAKQLRQISELYRNNYEIHIKRIKDNVIDDRENEIIILLDEAYKYLKDNKVLNEKYWASLERIVNKS